MFYEKKRKVMKIEDQQKYFEDLQSRSLETLIFMERKIEQTENEKDRSGKLAMLRVAISSKTKLKRSFHD